ncbi:hypothetical protein F3K32_42685 [Streptomyces sp. LBUM 1483]|uniref:hypothetical protein n=1 Tax=Streptomyces scabiei TaxID=1930 RepID=UPI001B34250F|nr:hypothetical protein [Streptomyces sp. LBUM 1483]MBP5926716.1 hypothetical protein [Streptomyces sp. LBUM 1483]
MSILLLGHYDQGGTLVVTESLEFEDDDEESMAAVSKKHYGGRDTAWACSFDVDRHSAAVQRAYDEYVRGSGDGFLDEAAGFEPDTR